MKLSFEIQNADHDVLIEETGRMIRYKKEVLVGDLPGTLRDTLNTKYNGHAIDDVDLFVIGEKSYYQIEFDDKLTNSKKVFNFGRREAGYQVLCSILIKRR